MAGQSTFIAGRTYRTTSAPEKRKANTCQFCGNHFERAEILAVHVLADHGDLIGSEQTIQAAPALDD